MSITTIEDRIYFNNIFVETTEKLFNANVCFKVMPMAFTGGYDIIFKNGNTAMIDKDTEGCKEKKWELATKTEIKAVTIDELVEIERGC